MHGWISVHGPLSQKARARLQEEAVQVDLQFEQVMHFLLRKGINDK